MKKLLKFLSLLCKGVGIAAISISMSGGVHAADTTKPIRIATIDSSDADFIAYVYGGILEKLGFNVEYLRIDYTAMIPAIETSDLDVTTSIWDTTSWPGIESAVSDNTAINYGSTGVEVEEGWWYPEYLTEVCPGLPDYEAFKSKACVAALTTAETSPKGRYVDAPADWEAGSDMRMKALGLNYEVINSGSIVTMIATVRAAVERKEPIFSWGYVPHWYFDSTPGGFVKLPPNTDACHNDASVGPNPDVTGDCGFSVGYVWKMATTGFSKKSPEAARILHLYQISTADVAAATDKIENDGIEIAVVAGEWIANNEGVWKKWPIN